MGLMSKILHKDKHQDEHPATATSSNTNTSSTPGHTVHDTTTGSHGLGSNTTSSGLGSSTHISNTTAGPHTSNTGNKIDPRVDSDNSRYNSNTVGGQHGFASDTHGHRNEYNTTSGPHASNAGNRIDPRVDSDNSRYTTGGVSGSHGQFADTAAGGHRGYGSTPGAFPTGGTGHGHSTGHSSQPHVERDDYGSSAGAAQNFSGRDAYNSSHTPGPVHNSDMLNKLDPRVDSNAANHGLSRDPAHNDHHRYSSADSGRQTGGFIGGPHERQENRSSVPTAGGLPVGAGGNGPHDGSHGGLTGSHGRDHQYESSHGGLNGSHGGLTGSHGRDQYDNSSSGLTGSHSASHGGLTGSHGHTNEPFSSNDRSGHGISSSGVSSGTGFGSGSHHTGGHGLSDLEYKEREIALRQKELDLKERELRINAGH